MQRLVAAYEEPQRRYHTLQHLNECVSFCDRNLHLAEKPGEVEMALWFHDAVYDVTGNENEAKSAAWAAESLASAGVAAEAIERVSGLIMATCHAVLPEGRDQQVLVDVDLSILGAVRPRFIEYEAQVRAEYRWVPEPLFRQKRAEVLQQFLARGHIYSTPTIRKEFEEVARGNLAYSLALLGAHNSPEADGPDGPQPRAKGSANQTPGNSRP